MKYLLLVFLYLFSNPLLAQSEIDSLEALLPQKKGLEKAILLNDLSYKYWHVSPDKGLDYAKRAYTIAIKENSKKDIAKSLKNIGVNYWAKSEFNAAVENYLAALKIYKELNDPQGISALSCNLGSVYLDLSDYEKSLKYSFSSLKIAKENELTNISTLALSNISAVYLGQKNYLKALEYIQEAIDLSEKQKNTANLDTQLNTLGEIYSLQKDYKKAIATYKKSLALFKKNQNNYGVAICLYNIGETEFILKNYTSAKKYFEESLTISTKINDHVGILLANKSIGNIFKEQGQFDFALSRYDIALEVTSKLDSKEEKLDLYKNYAELYKAMGKFDKSLQYLENFNALKDSIDSQNNSAHIAEMQTKYATAKKEKENELLRTSSQMQELAIAKQTNIRNSFVGLSILAVLLIIILLSRFAIKKKANKLLIQKNEVISKQRDELKQINSTKDKFFSIISHDLRSPFGNILGITNLLAEDYDSFSEVERKEIITELNKSAQTTFELLGNLLTWSQTQTGQIEINKETLNLKELIDTSCAPYVSIAAHKNIDVICTVPQEGTIYMDKNTASVIISNLINNAIKFTPNNGKLTVDYVDNKNTTELHIIDTGVGMSKETISKLFKIEEHVSTKGTNNEDGTGLGLILCKEFITKNGGEISVTSEVGKGSHFIISLPKKPQL